MRAILKIFVVVTFGLGVFFIYLNYVAKKPLPDPITEKAKTVDNSPSNSLSDASLHKDSTNRIAPGDLLHIWVTNEPDLDRKVRVQSDGSIYFSFIRDIQASGRTPMEVTDEIRSRMLRYVPNAEVTVSIIKNPDEQGDRGVYKKAN